MIKIEFSPRRRRKMIANTIALLFSFFHGDADAMSAAVAEWISKQKAAR